MVPFTVMWTQQRGSKSWKDGWRSEHFVPAWLHSSPFTYVISCSPHVHPRTHLTDEVIKAKRSQPAFSASQSQEAVVPMVIWDLWDPTALWALHDTRCNAEQK